MSLPRIRAILADYDGTLVNSSETGRRALRRLCREVGRPQTFQDRRVVDGMWGGSGLKILDFLFPRETVMRLIRTGVIPKKTYWEGREWLTVQWGEYSDVLRPKLFSGARRTLRRLKQAGIVVGIASNAEAPRLFRNLMNFGLGADHLDFAVASTHGDRHSIGALADLRGSPRFVASPYRKPERQFMQVLIRELRHYHVLPRACVVWGDTETDAKTAVAIGAYLIAVCYGPHHKTSTWWRKTVRALVMPEDRFLGAVVSIQDGYELIMDYNARADSTPS